MFEYSMDTSFFYEVIPSPLGDVGIVWVLKNVAPSVARIFLPQKDGAIDEAINSEYPGAVKESKNNPDKIRSQIREYMKGYTVEFSLESLDMEQCYDFQKKVLLKLSQVPRGKVVSYGQLAGKIGAPGAARAVGTALARNPFPIILPCHRVVKSTGHPGNFGGGQKLKEALLRLEGIKLSDKGKIDHCYFW